MSERSTESGLVGRAGLLTRLLSDVDTAVRGVPAMSVLTGPPGVGRTAVLTAVVAAAERRAGVTTRYVACAAGEEGHAFRGAAALLGAGPPPSGTLASRWLSDRLRALAGTGAVLLAVDDAQWCDEASVTWLDTVVRRGAPVAVLLARRHSATPPAAVVAFGAAAPRGRVLELPPLSAADLAPIAARVWRVGLAPEFLHACVTGARGLPAVVLRAFVRLAGVEPVAANADTAAAAGLAAFAEEMPALLAREPAHVCRVVEALAVLGTSDVEPSVEIVSLLSQVPERLTRSALDLLRGWGVLVEDRAPAAVRDAVLAGLSTADLDRRRRAAARVLDVCGVSPVAVGDQLAALTSLAEPGLRPLLDAAAAEAEETGRAVEAIRFRRRLLDEDPDDLGMLADFARVAAEYEPRTVHAALTEGLPRAAGGADRARLAAQLGRVGVVLGQSSAAAEELDRATRALPRGADPDAAAELEVARRSVALCRGEPAPEGTRPLGRTRVDREILALRALALVEAADPAAVAEARRALAGPPLLGWLFAGAAYVLDLADEPEEASAGLAGAELAAPWSRAIALSLRAMARLAGGEVAGALADAAAAAESCPPSVAALAGAALAMARCRAGDVAGARDALGGVEGAPMSSPVVPRVLTARAAVAELAGDRDGALSSLHACGALGGAGLVPWWLDAARLHGPGQRSRELAEIGAGIAARWGTPAVRGQALLARGVAEDDAETLAEAAWRLARLPWYQGVARVLLAERLVRGGDGATARRELRAAEELAVRCGFTPLAEQARAGLVAAGGRPHAVGAGELTDAERRVAVLAAAGATNRQIAETLLVSLRTVEIHLTSVYRKLGVSGRTELAGALDR